MKVIIEGSPKEIAALALELQERRWEEVSSRFVTDHEVGFQEFRRLYQVLESQLSQEFEK